ncbi:TonB-dependent receptor domain-containing protein [Echinimonas agarilytica]|uniref:TonB-dependent receptor n=1 Tax=Echinimonas agarilytica TaxID=1215918 RepID=A0AA41W5T0_9GAMM|nr:TonB-dependent receptor [Echinimonas agarilytica]MCM2679407.1 TonB-dependent receptor [Echinimonas agarilytica]
MSTLRLHPCAIAVAVSAAVFTQLSYAQDEQSSESVERISVWSTAIKASSMYMSGEDLANKQADHISDLLRSIPGVDVGGAHSLNQRITIRSMDDKDLDISIDGAKQNTYMYHHMGNLQIHADILKSVDIDVGTNSVINGGLGGSVKFETKQARELLNEGQDFGGRVQLSAGDNSGTNYSASGYGVFSENFDFLAYYNHVDRDNYDVGGGKIKGADGQVIDGTDGKVRGLEGELDDALIKFGWNLASNQRIQLSYEKYKDEGDYSYRPDMGLATDQAITDSLQIPLLWPTELTRDTITLNYELTTDATLLKAAVYSNTSELWRDETGYAQNPDYAAWAGIITGEAKNTGINAIAETAFDGNIEHDVTYGFDYVKHETDYRGKYPASTDTSDEEATNLAFFVQDRITLNQYFAVIPGLRYDRYDIDSVVVDNDFNDTSLALALEYQAADNLLVKLSATELFKGPEIGEVFVGAGLFDTANPGIDAETGVNYEFSFAYRSEALITGTLSLGATVFKTDINDYIYDYATPPEGVDARSWKDNIGDMEVDGFEAYATYSLGGFDGTVTFSRAESELDAFDAYADLDGARLDRQQGDTVSANINYSFDSIAASVFWEVLYVDDVDPELDLDGATLDNSKDGYTVHNVSARWEPETVEGLTIIAGVDNVFDEFYASQSSRTGVSFHPRFGELYLQDFEPGRNIKATVSYQF